MKIVAAAVVTIAALSAASPAFAQSAPPTREQRDLRYQIGMMEGVLEKAVEHGAAVVREHLQRVMPADMLLSQPPRVRGVRLEGYGVVFDIDVPTLQSTSIWSLQTLDQNNLGLESAMNEVRAHVNASGDTNLKQALQRIELAVPLPTLVNTQGAPAAPPRQTTGSALAANDTPQADSAPDPIVANPGEAYHTQIQDALMEAMLDHSRGLGINPDERLTVIAGGVDIQPLAGLDSDGYMAVISIKGSDLADFLANRISHDEARQRIQVKLF
jgi:hypothetical protein